MNTVIERKLKNISEEQQLEERSLVLEGFRQVKEGKVRDFNTVCDRLEKKYKNAAI